MEHLQLQFQIQKRSSLMLLVHENWGVKGNHGEGSGVEDERSSCHCSAQLHSHKVIWIVQVLQSRM